MLWTLTEEEQEKVILQLAEGQKEFTEEDALKVLDWASKAMLEKTLIEMVLNSKLILSIEQGEVYYNS